MSSSYRRELRTSSASDYRKAIESWLTRGATGAKLVNYVPTDKQSENGFNLDVEFSAARYGQLMQNRLFVFKPVVVGRRNSITLTDAKRSTPVELNSFSMRETATFELPAGFVVDEMPEAVNLATEFGSYSTKYVAVDGKLVFTRALTIRRSIIPANKYASVRDFFIAVRQAEQSPVVLVRK